MSSPSTLPTSTTPTNPAGLKITVDLSETPTTNEQDEIIASRILADEEDLINDVNALDDSNDKDDDNKGKVRRIDNSGLFNKPEKVLKNVIVTQDRRYLNRHAQNEFVVGFERGTEQWNQKRKQRGSRFGTGEPDEVQVEPISPPPQIPVDFDVSDLYEKVGLSEEVLNRESSNLRLNTLHVQGVDDLSTDNVLWYFRHFNPTHIEWIDDSSCNVVWTDDISAARALFCLSTELQDDEQKEEEDVNKAEVTGEVSISGENLTEEIGHKEVGLNNEMEITNDEAKVVEDDQGIEADEEDETEKKLRDMGVAKMHADREEGEMSDNEVEVGNAKTTEQEEEERNKKEQERLHIADLKWRSGIWKGRGKRERQLFMRFATIFDKKQIGANKYSKYYEKYGNPNFNNLPGLISNSMRRRMAGSKKQKQLEEAKAALKVLGGDRRDTESAMDELASMGAGHDNQDDEALYQKRKTNSGRRSWSSRGGAFGYKSNQKNFSLNRYDDNEEGFQGEHEIGIPKRQSRQRIGSSEGRCPPPSPRDRNLRQGYGDEQEEDEYAHDSTGDESVQQMLSSVPVKGRGSTRTKLYADEEREKIRGNSSRMRSDYSSNRDRSRSRSPLKSFFIKPDVKRRRMTSDEEEDDRDFGQRRRGGGDIRDRLGPRNYRQNNRRSINSRLG